MPVLVNARLDKANSSAWKDMWKSSRVIVPADVWYEWVLEEGAKQPYFIQPLDGKLLFLAGLSTIPPGGEHHDGNGFVIVTDASDAGMLDIHDRRPLVLTAEEAKEWLEPENTFEEANHLANTAATPVEAFRWFRVSNGVNRVGNDEPAFTSPSIEIRLLCAGDSKLRPLRRWLVVSTRVICEMQGERRLRFYNKSFQNEKNNPVCGSMLDCRHQLLRKNHIFRLRYR
ncbi:hypothetical protein AX768_02165 [Burkholderia sp. PAMC 28687]|uniref:SOS response-associated peptidase n=1 Tax=Burkholderia sp. PAMC 28687 TaxID=1795874 RepID=UPI00078641E0|nr:SOS response-associated peptidase family protein [Burkholderia sp. PAMC 28687]AMM13094.1 hypothetical protein AX768_02165 [Burkholderia sp. PAMC 28687]